MCHAAAGRSSPRTHEPTEDPKILGLVPPRDSVYLIPLRAYLVQHAHPVLPLWVSIALPSKATRPFQVKRRILSHIPPPNASEKFLPAPAAKKMVLLIMMAIPNMAHYPTEHPRHTLWGIHATKCMVQLGNLHGWTSQLAWLDSRKCMVGLAGLHGSALTTASDRR